MLHGVRHEPELAVELGQLEVHLDQARVDWFAELNRSLQDRHDEGSVRTALRANVQRLRDLARELHALAQAEGGVAPDAALAELLAATPAPVSFRKFRRPTSRPACGSATCPVRVRLLMKISLRGGTSTE